MEWIKVEDRVPEFGALCICRWSCVGSDGISVGVLNEIRRIDRLDESCTSMDWSIYSSVGETSEIVTHWMPLPEPPKDN